MKLDEIVAPGFASAGKYAPGVRCNGVNHNHWGTAGTCPGCGMPVARISSGGIFDVVDYDTPGGGHRTAIRCYRLAHECDPVIAEGHRLGVAHRLLAGELIIGAPVRVARGRKVPVGTEGRLFWLVDEGGYGPRAGLRVEPTETEAVFVAAENLVVALDDELRAECEQLIEAARDEAAAQEAAEAAARADGDARFAATQAAVRAKVLADIVEDVRTGEIVGRRIERLGRMPGKGAPGRYLLGHAEIVEARVVEAELPGFEITARDDEGRTFVFTDDAIGESFRLLQR